MLRDTATWPAGTVQRDNYLGGCEDMIEVPLPPDGVLVFDSIDMNGNDLRGCNAHLGFARNAANTPVTILVKGERDDPQQRSHHREWLRRRARLDRRAPAGRGSAGPAASPAAQGAYQLVNFASIGGNGIGPGGGLGATVDPLALAAGGIFVGVPELRPLLGGSGGGGGRSARRHERRARAAVVAAAAARS